MWGWKFNVIVRFFFDCARRIARHSVLMIMGEKSMFDVHVDFGSIKKIVWFERVREREGDGENYNNNKYASLTSERMPRRENLIVECACIGAGMNVKTQKVDTREERNFFQRLSLFPLFEWETTSFNSIKNIVTGKIVRGRVKSEGKGRFFSLENFLRKFVIFYR